MAITKISSNRCNLPRSARGSVNSAKCSWNVAGCSSAMARVLLRPLSNSPLQHTPHLPLCQGSLPPDLSTLLHAFALWGPQLPLANRMHDFHARYGTPRRPKRLETEHGPREAFYSSVILFHDVIEIFGVVDGDCGLAGPVVARDRCRIGATLVDGDLLWWPLVANGLA